MLEVRLPHVRAWAEIAATAKAMDHQLCRMDGIKVRVIERLWIQDVQLFRIVLRPSRVQVEVDLWMGTAERLFKARI